MHPAQRIPLQDVAAPCIHPPMKWTEFFIPTSRGGGPPVLVITRRDCDIGFADPLLDENKFAHVVALDSVPEPLKGVAEDHQPDRPPPQRPRRILKLHDNQIAGQREHGDGDGMKKERGGMLMTN